MTATIEAAAAPSAATFRQLIAYIQPNAEEYGWLRIPWQPDLWEARRQAATEDKPMFLWGMNGNPLGLT